jgi:hypothetical protein
MKTQEIRAIAKQKGVNSARMKKADLIRSIQRAEGNFDCFGTPAGGGCDQSACAWREDCLAGVSAGRPRK